MTEGHIGIFCSSFVISCESQMVSKRKVVFFKGGPHPLPHNCAGHCGLSEGPRGPARILGLQTSPQGWVPSWPGPRPCAFCPLACPSSLRGLREGVWGTPGSARPCRPALAPGSLPLPPPRRPASHALGLPKGTGATHGRFHRTNTLDATFLTGLPRSSRCDVGTVHAAARAGLARAAPSQRGCGAAVGRVPGVCSLGERAAPRSPCGRRPQACVWSFPLPLGG